MNDAVRRDPTVDAGRRLLALGSGLRGVVLCFAVYGLVHAILSMAGGPSLALDDAKLNVLVQTVQVGYLPENPPLFEWLLIMAQALLGAGPASFALVKYVLLATAAVFAFLAVRRLTGDAAAAGAAAFMLTLVYQVGWSLHQTLTHTVALLAAVALFWHVFLRVVETRRTIDYAALGLALGLGALAKYSFIAAALVAFVAALIRPATRSAVLDPRASLAVAVALCVAGPHLLWLASENAGVGGAAVARLQGGAEPYLARIASGLPEAVWAIAAFFLPLAPILAVAAGPSVLDLRSSVDGPARLARDASLLGGAGLVLAVLMIGMGGMQERYAVPFLYPAVLFFAARLNLRAASRVATASLAAALVVVGVRVSEVAIAGPPFCSSCRQWIDYRPLAEALTRAGYAQATLVGYEDHTAGNLRRLLPEARVMSAHMPFHTPPGGADRPCVFVYSPQLAPPSDIVAFFDPSTSFEVVAARKRGAGEAVAWTVAPMDHDPAQRASLCRPGGARR